MVAGMADLVVAQGHDLMTADDYRAQQTGAVVISIDCEPPPEVSPNWHGHWQGRARGVRMYRAFARLATNRVHRDAKHAVDGAYRVVMDVEIRWPPRRKIHDDDNAWTMIKPARDGIADALGIDDKIFKQGQLVQVRGGGSTIITLRGEG